MSLFEPCGLRGLGGGLSTSLESFRRVLRMGMCGGALLLILKLFPLSCAPFWEGYEGVSPPLSLRGATTKELRLRGS